ncbi:GNAT family N-acetyltransferase [Massilia rhizosphaerae]|uniref:GNAT family N-acetyltransferase n=1 Tax=Massilia rhizosphaerae TaxID=2784389 RepID=UPI0018DBD714|nr:GNAT family N-acetyltransferase [Massilia rhizosphaerae]
MTTPFTAIAYRPMGEFDLPAAHALSQAVRWPHRPDDWHFALRLGAGFVAEDDGAVVGTALCWDQGPHHGSLGLIIVSPAHQGKGIGRGLMRLVLDRLGDRCTLLNATAAGQPLYESLGFRAIGTLHQHQGTLAAPPPPAGPCPRPAEARDVAAIIALANRGTGMARDELLKQLIGVAEGAVLERDGEVAGFSLIRPFGRGYVIGPVVAPDTDGAQTLIATWSDAYAGAFVRVDVTGSSGLGEWLAQAGLAEVDTAVTMARNGVPPRDGTVQQFAIVSQALC